MVLLEVPDDVKETDVGADDAGKEADDEDEGVLQRAPDSKIRVMRCISA